MALSVSLSASMCMCTSAEIYLSISLKLSQARRNGYLDRRNLKRKFKGDSMESRFQEGGTKGILKLKGLGL